MAEPEKRWDERITEPNASLDSGVRAKVVDETRPLRGMRVLWLDADQSHSAECRSMLEGWGAAILVVDDAGAGVDTVAATSPDAVVISYDRDDASCDQLARVLHYMVAKPPPVIVVSKRDLRGFDGALPGVVRVLPKPFYPRALLDTLLTLQKR